MIWTFGERSRKCSRRGKEQGRCSRRGEEQGINAGFQVEGIAYAKSWKPAFMECSSVADGWNVSGEQIRGHTLPHCVVHLPLW